MKAQPLLLFPPFRLDMGNEQLWHGAHAVVLRPKTFAVLRYLVEHPGRLVTKEEVLDAVWGQTVVSESVLKSCIRELRKALADAAQTPRYIETVHRRGYRWIAETRDWRLETSPPTPQVSSLKPQVSTLVGREAELTQLHEWLEKALEGERQIVFVTGEPGIGKTTVVEAFLEQIQEARGWRLETRSSSPQASGLKTQASSLWIGRGQCIEHYGAGEAYLPVLEALGRLCREPGGERLIKLLSQHAPTWLVQMPALLSPVELEALQRKVLGATPERMLREMAEAMEALTAERGLVLRFEDLQWSDYSTLNLISYLAARRQERARLLMIGTYRPVEVLGHGHPLRAVTQELRVHGHCAELPVRWLTEAAVAQYLAVRFDIRVQHRPGFSTGQVPFQSLAQVIHQHTEGNPLFMVNVVEHMVAQGSLVQVKGRWVLRGGVEEVAVSVPENLRQMIEKHLDRLSPEEQRVLEVASVAGMEFSAATVAAGVEAAGDEVEERCAGLARRGQFLQVRGLAEWPDGTVATRYGFIHALYQEIVYQRVPAGRRVHLHRRIGEREEAAYGKRAGEIAAELAVHFERGRDYHRTVHYLQQTGENAARRHAYRETIDHLTKGLELLQTLPDTPERLQKELLLQTTLGPALIATKGQAAPEVGKVYARAYELCQQEGESSQLFTVSRGLRFFYLARGEFQTAYELSEQLLRLAQRLHDPALLLEAHHALGALLFWLGEFASAQKAL
ncbi:MAG TPA: AAA family ATPase [Candidatus Binatia bacterium]|jgi:predicted ATPase|nr:AAA family ATPase [Candidatus Binatia bacterium]